MNQSVTDMQPSWPEHLSKLFVQGSIRKGNFVAGSGTNLHVKQDRNGFGAVKVITRETLETLGLQSSLKNFPLLMRALETWSPL